MSKLKPKFGQHFELDVCFAMQLIRYKKATLDSIVPLAKQCSILEEDEEDFEKGKVLFCEEKRTQLLHLLGLFLLRSKVFVVEAEKLFVVYDNQRSDK